jgi:ApaG protein
MYTYSCNSENITVSVTPEYVPDRSDPDGKSYMFYYHVTITNNSDNSIVVLNRNLTIKEGCGKVWKNEGSGLLGEQPLIRSSGSYTYTSFAPLNTSISPPKLSLHQIISPVIGEGIASL